MINIQKRSSRRLTSRLIYSAGIISLVFAILISVAGVVFAQTAPGLGVSSSYSILAGLSVTNSGSSTVPGNVGISPGAGIPPNVTGWSGVTLGGVLNDSNAAALAAMAAAGTAVGAMESQGPGTTLDSSELAGRVLTHGVYTVPGTALLSGTVNGGVLTLDGNGVFIFLTNGLTSTGTVRLTGAANSCNVFWRDASSASIAATSSGTPGTFIGTIIALTSITLTDGATVAGRTFAQTGIVTLIGNTYTGPPICSAPSSGGSELLPETGANLTPVFPYWLSISLGILGLGLVVFGFMLNRKPTK
jgi:hypothetical protein